LAEKRAQPIDKFPKTVFEWNDEYLIGVTAIDQQHKHWFALGERFHHAVATGKGKAMLDELLEALVRYTNAHFHVEERLMASIDYPEREQHIAQHRDLVERLKDFQHRFESGDTAMTIQVLQFLSRWLITHTTTTDRQLGQYHRSGAKQTITTG